MALSFVIRKAVSSLSPKLVVPLFVPNALRSMSTLGGSISQAIEVTPLQQDHPDHSDDPPAIKLSLRRASDKRASNKKLFNDLKPKKSVYNNSEYVNLDGFSVEEIPSSTTLVLTRQDSDERIQVEVNMSDIESKEDKLSKPVPMTVNVIREHATNQFKIFLGKKGIRISSMTLVSDTDQEEYAAVVNYCELDDLWQQRLLDYLEVRGIRLGLSVYLKDYLNEKKRMENTLLWKSRFIDFFLKPEKSSDDE